jgi:5-methylcytosine-specific restriction endonuclease McrBC regulatory subunit McrC
VIGLAAALVRNMAPNPVAPGSGEGFALLFPLNDLFEAVLRRALPEALHLTDVRLVARERAARLLTTPEGASVMYVKPDYVFRQGDIIPLVGDAKWKELTQSGRAHGLRPADVYQIAAYMERHACSRSLAFFPRTHWMPTGWQASYRFADASSVLTLVGVDVPALVSRDRARRQAAILDLRGTVLRSLEADR